MLKQVLVKVIKKGEVVKTFKDPEFNKPVNSVDFINSIFTHFQKETK